MTTSTAVYIFKGAHVLLTKPKTSLGTERWNGLTGAIEIGENAKMAAARMVKSSVGVMSVLNEPASEILYHDSAHRNWKVAVFRVDTFQGEPVATGNIAIQWWPIDDLPYKTMWPGDDEWLPLVIGGKAFSAEVWFDDKGRVEKKDIQPL